MKLTFSSASQQLVRVSTLV